MVLESDHGSLRLKILAIGMLREQTLIVVGCGKEQLHLTGWHAVSGSRFIGLESKNSDSPHAPFSRPVWQAA